MRANYEVITSIFPHYITGLIPSLSSIAVVVGYVRDVVVCEVYAACASGIHTCGSFSQFAL
jgi:hypothetical protein